MRIECLCVRVYVVLVVPRVEGGARILEGGARILWNVTWPLLAIFTAPSQYSTLIGC